MEKRDKFFQTVCIVHEEAEPYMVEKALTRVGYEVAKRYATRDEWYSVEFTCPIRGHMDEMRFTNKEDAEKFLKEVPDGFLSKKIRFCL